MFYRTKESWIVPVMIFHVQGELSINPKGWLTSGLLSAVDRGGCQDTLWLKHSGVMPHANVFREWFGIQPTIKMIRLMF